MARSDPALAGEGAVLLLEKLSPALCDIDSSSGALGSATHAAAQDLVPIIATAQATDAVRDRWLERLFDTYQDDETAGALCQHPLCGSFQRPHLSRERRDTHERSMGEAHQCTLKAALQRPFNNDLKGERNGECSRQAVR